MAALTEQPQRIDYYSLNLFDGAPSTPPDTTTALEDVLPGFPSQYDGERVWTGSDMIAKQDEWIVGLTDQDRADVLQALRHFQGLNLKPGALSRETFPLPEDLVKKLRTLTHGCYEGRGFAVLRGLDPSAFSDEENVLIFGGISSHVAPTRGFQDLAREMVTCHVLSEDMRPGSKEQNLRPAFTNNRLAFHTDVGDILALFALDVSDTGGETMIVSSSQIYNQLAAMRPDLLAELGKDWAFFHSQDYYTDGTPLITNTASDQLVFQFSRLPITGFRSQKGNPTLPPPTAQRLEAMAYIEDLAWKHAFPLPRKQGDIAFINNLCLMHARSAFDLDAEGNPLPSRRHLVKLMLQDPEMAWELPGHLEWYSKRVYGPNREDGGREETWQLSVKDESLPDGRIWAGSGALSNG